MAKKIENQDVAIQENDGTFIDRTDQKWYHKNGTNKVIFCESIDELVEGKSESHDFVKKQISTKTVVRNGEKVERNYFVLFFFLDGSVILTGTKNELK